MSEKKPYTDCNTRIIDEFFMLSLSKILCNNHKLIWYILSVQFTFCDFCNGFFLWPVSKAIWLQEIDSLSLNHFLCDSAHGDFYSAVFFF